MWEFQLGVFDAIRNMMPYPFYFLIAVNCIAFVMYGLDKVFAISRMWRIPEANLLGIALLYGALGAFVGMKLFHHKTKHIKFTFTVPFLLILQIAFALGCIYL